MAAYSQLVWNIVHHMKVRKVLKSFSIYKWISEISKNIASEDVVSRLQETKTLHMCKVVLSQFVVLRLSTDEIVFSFCEGRGHIISIWEQFTSVMHTHSHTHEEVVWNKLREATSDLRKAIQICIINWVNIKPWKALHPSLDAVI